MDKVEVFGKKFNKFELFNGLGQSLAGRLEIHLAVLLRHVAEKKHSRLLLINATNGMHPTFIPGMTKTGGGYGSIIRK